MLDFNPVYIVRIVSIVLCAYLAMKNRPDDFPFQKNSVALFWGMLGAVGGYLGVKLFFIAYHWVNIDKYVVVSGGNVLKFIFSCGYGSIGYLIGIFGVCFVATKLRKNRISYFLVSDYALPFFLLSIGIIRIECFLMGCCHGRVTDLPWGCSFPVSGDSLLRHPTQIYSTIFLVVIFLLARIAYKKNLYSGFVTFFCICLYGIFRFFNEFLRVDSPKIFLHLKLSQMSMILFILTGILGMCFRYNIVKNKKLKKT